MNNEILMLQPVFMERIWGGTKLKDVFGYDIPYDLTGEAWTISAHKDGSSVILNGEYQGKTLRWLFNNRRDLFNNIDNEEFPLLVKILDAQNDLSVQVHPNDELAVKYNDLGKTECWYVLDCPKNSELIYGHTAKTKEEFANMISNNEWDKLLTKKAIKPGDFVFVPAGKVHALTKGTLILEIQQSSNVTFRLYDYDRKDASGNYRDLHIQESIEVTTVPDPEVEVKRTIEQVGSSQIETLIKSSFFSVEKWNIKDQYHREIPSYMVASVLKGKGSINDIELKVGDNFLITSQCLKVEVTGDLEIVVGYI